MAMWNPWRGCIDLKKAWLTDQSFAKKIWI